MSCIQYISGQNNTHRHTQDNTHRTTQYTQNTHTTYATSTNKQPHTHTEFDFSVNLSVFVLSCGRYLGGGGEPAAEGVEDAEAVVQSERLSVFTEEVDQLAAFFLQLLPTAAQ